jgi:hypothetical protein
VDGTWTFGTVTPGTVKLGTVTPATVTAGVLTLGVLTLGSDTGGVGSVTGGLEDTGGCGTLTGGAGLGGFGIGTVPLGGAAGGVGGGAATGWEGGALAPIVVAGLVVLETPGARAGTVGVLGRRLRTERRRGTWAAPICPPPCALVPFAGAPPVFSRITGACPSCRATVTDAPWRCSAGVFARTLWESVSRPAAPIAGRIVVTPVLMPAVEGIARSPSRMRCGIVPASAHHATERREE